MLLNFACINSGLIDVHIIQGPNADEVHWTPIQTDAARNDSKSISLKDAAKEAKSLAYDLQLTSCFVREPNVIMDPPKKFNVSKEPNSPHQILVIDDRSKLIKAKVTPISQTNESNYPSNRSTALDRRPPQSVQSDGSHRKLIRIDQCESPKITNTPITDGPADAFIQSAATREYVTTNRSDDIIDCHVSIRPSNVSNADQSAELHAAVSNQSAESVVCRICHLSATESSKQNFAYLGLAYKNYDKRRRQAYTHAWIVVHLDDIKVVGAALSYS